MKYKYTALNYIFNLPFLKHKKDYDTFHVNFNKFNIAVTNLHPSLNGMKILFISDLHLDITPTNIDKAIDIIINNEYDFCFLGGDYIDDPSHFDHHKILFKKFLNSLDHNKTFAILGNHDNIEIKEYIIENNITVLENDKRTITFNNTDIDLTGIEYTNEPIQPDFSSLLSNFKKNKLSILLAHNPDNFIYAEKYGYDIQFSGHTHNGQIQLPFGISPITHTKYGKKVLNGVWRHKNLQGFTSSGLGCSRIPVRYNTLAEIALITLT